MMENLIMILLISERKEEKFIRSTIFPAGAGRKNDVIFLYRPTCEFLVPRAKLFNKHFSYFLLSSTTSVSDYFSSLLYVEILSVNLLALLTADFDGLKIFSFLLVLLLNISIISCGNFSFSFEMHTT